MREHDEESATTTAWSAGTASFRKASRRRLIIAVGVVGGAAALLLVVLIVVLATRNSHGKRDSGRATAVASQPPATPPALKPQSADAAPPPPPPPTWIALRVGRVAASPLTPAGDTWDGAQEERDNKGLCHAAAKVVGALGAAATAGAGGIGGAAGGAVSIGCELFAGGRQRQSDPRDPDLFVRLIAEPEVEYRSYVAIDRLSHLFDYVFVVPTRAIPKSGLLLVLADADDDDPDGREIGSVRLLPDVLIAAAREGRILDEAEEAGLPRLELVVSEYDGGLQKTVFRMAASQGGVRVTDFPVYAGEVLRIEAEGAYRVGSWYDATVTPEGYPGGGPAGYDFDPAFKRAPHAVAIAVVGQRSAVDPVVVGRCAKTVSRLHGAILVGINDSDPGNNSGALTFRVLKRGPGVSQWRRAGARLPCD